MLRGLLFFLFVVLDCFVVHANTETLNWYVDDNLYATTTCESGGDVLLPTTPTKYGHTFVGWTAYTQIEYLRSTGTQYIDTGLTPTYGDKYVLTVSYPAVSGSERYFFGSLATNNGLLTGLKNGYFSFRALGVNETKQSSFSASVDTQYTYEINFNKNNTCIIANNAGDIVDTLTTTSTATPNTLHMFLFGYNYLGSPSKTAIKIYSFKVYNDNVLTHDFIPVLNDVGIPCMYERISDTFFYNSGTGDFIDGPIIN